jgi:hypothetical protein
MDPASLMFHGAVVGIHTGPRVRRHVLLGQWLPIYMKETQRKRPPDQFHFVECVADNAQIAESYVAKQLPRDTRELSFAEYASIEKLYTLVPVTKYASENDCYATAYRRLSAPQSPQQHQHQHQHQHQRRR